MKIVSYNINNLKTDSKSENRNFHKKRCQKISKILKKSSGDVIVLQECLSKETAEDIADMLGYVYCTSETLYSHLNKDEKFRNKHFRTFKSEFAILWNPQVLQLKQAPFLYEQIYEKTERYIDSFISGFVAVITAAASFRAAGNILKQLNENSLEAEKKRKKLFAGTGAVALGITAGAGGYVYSPSEKHLHHTSLIRSHVESFLQQSLRPPLVVIFEKVNSSDAKDLRLIDIHIKFTKSKNESDEEKKLCIEEIRKMEARFLLGRIFSIVNSQRDGKDCTPITIVAGDYNMSQKELGQENDSGRDNEFMPDNTFVPSLKDAENEVVITVQAERSTRSIANKKDVEQGAKPEIVESSNYDHFSYIKNIFGKENPEATVLPCEDDDILLENKLISDHVPITMEFEF